ncbi:FAD-dependent oxidoreductase [compost metagenome]
MKRGIQDLDLKGVSLRVLRIAPASDLGEADLIDTQGLLGQRYDMQPNTTYLLRPDQHVCARWRQPSAAQIHRALMSALAIH